MTTLLKHPTIPGLEISVPDDRVDSHLASGWLHVLDEEQRERLSEIALEVDLGAPPSKPRSTRKR